VSAARGAADAPCPHPVGRRAADARDRARLDDRADFAHARRADGGAGTARRRRGLPSASPARRRRDRRADGGAEREGGAARVGPRLRLDRRTQPLRGNRSRLARRPGRGRGVSRWGPVRGPPGSMIQALADGILTGAIIALGAIGVTFTLAIMRFANFAHSELLTWGAYLALVVVAFAGPGTPTGPLSFGWQLLAAALIAAILTGLAAWAVDLLVFRRLRRQGAMPLTMVFAAFGAALVMRHLIVLVWGHESRYYTRELQMAVELLPGVRVLPDQMFILGLALAAMIALHAFLAWSRTGIAMRAMAESPALAQVCGVEVEAVVRLTWIISGALAAFAGVFVGLTPQLHPEIGFNLLLSLFAAAIFGGTGSLAGAVVGGFLVGLGENLSLLVISPGYKGAMPFLLLLAILILRPQGIFGERK